MGGIISDQIASDGSEADDFVRHQLLLSTAIEAYFGVPRSECRTLFRNDLVGLSLFVAHGGEIPQALCRRPAAQSPWRLIDLGPAPRWCAYEKSVDLGVLVTQASLSTDSPLDPTRNALLKGFVFSAHWDVPAPSGGDVRHPPGTREP